MKLRAIYIAVFVATLLVSIPWVRAPAYITTDADWSRTAIKSGYGVTTNYHGIEVLIGTEVTAYAGTTNDDIKEVKFRWTEPDGDVVVEEGTYIGDELWEGLVIHVWSSPKIPMEVGDWGVQGHFYNEGGHGVGPIPEQPESVATRAQSFYAVPEVATIAAVLAMFGAFGLFAIKKKRIRTPL